MKRKYILQWAIEIGCILWCIASWAILFRKGNDLSAYRMLLIQITLICLLQTGCLFYCRKTEKRLSDAELVLLWLEQKDLSGFLMGDEQENAPVRVRKIVERMVQLIGDRYSAKILEKQMEYSALQSQINPHFLYNTLEAIRSEALLCGQPDIASMTERLSRFFRYCISNRGDYVTLREELGNVNDYFYIQKYRFENRFSLEVRCREEEVWEFVLPKLTLQPLMENAIYHGLEQKKGDGHLSISIVGTDDRIYITVSDDGIGMSEEDTIALNNKLGNPMGSADITGSDSKKHGTGIALTNVNGRLKLFFGSEADMHVSSTLGKGTDILLTLPCRRMPRNDVFAQPDRK